MQILEVVFKYPFQKKTVGKGQFQERFTSNLTDSNGSRVKPEL